MGAEAPGSVPGRHVEAPQEAAEEAPHRNEVMDEVAEAAVQPTSGHEVLYSPGEVEKILGSIERAKANVRPITAYVDLGQDIVPEIDLRAAYASVFGIDKGQIQIVESSNRLNGYSVYYFYDVSVKPSRRLGSYFDNYNPSGDIDPTRTLEVLGVTEDGVSLDQRVVFRVTPTRYGDKEFWTLHEKMSATGINDGVVHSWKGNTVYSKEIGKEPVLKKRDTDFTSTLEGELQTGYGVREDYYGGSKTQAKKYLGSGSDTWRFFTDVEKEDYVVVWK